MIAPQLRLADSERRTADVDSTRRGERGPSHPRVVLLFTRDRALDDQVAQALLGRSAIVLIARSVGDALQIVCGRGRELDLVVLDVDAQSGGMTLLSAVHTCHTDLPVLVTAMSSDERVRTLAFANGARACLNKPLALATLGDAISELSGPRAV